ncbi:hypothetical protein WH47_11708 [Habropoda laboriosa]|uniref:Uncharacterized protein n=1 Tax=Habropoda laboriosa TaxID=597456 RepID=A0A0L7R847_9HYME|nr:hypothetical protein WH47_11708 [Habropoda laboriosa]
MRDSTRYHHAPEVQLCRLPTVHAGNMARDKTSLIAAALRLFSPVVAAIAKTKK